MTLPRHADSVAWSRARWEERGGPKPAQFAAMTSLMRATAVMTAELDRVLKTVKLTRTGYLVLITLQLSNDQARPLGQLSKALLVHPTTVTMVVDQLERAKLVQRTPHPTDRRTILACLTAKGIKVTNQANDALAAAGFAVGDIDDDTAEGLVEDLRALRRGLGDDG